MFATLWLSGAVALTLGMSDMSLETCNGIKAVMEEDIRSGVTIDPDGSKWVKADNGERHPWQEWSVTCEPEALAIGSKSNV